MLLLEVEPMDEKNTENTQSKIITIPNLLSMFRIVLIPVIAWLYTKQEAMAAGILMLISGITDVVDGFIARHFHMVSNLGKILDPVADKLTQVTMLICLVSRFPWVIVPVVLMFTKEIFMSITGVLVIRKAGKVMGAVWHGKAATVCLFITILLHIFWYDIPPALSIVMVVLSSSLIILSFVLYGKRNFDAIKQAKKAK